MSKFGLKFKMLLSFFVISILLVVVGALGSYAVKKIISNYQVILDTNFTKLKLVNSMSGYAKDTNLPVLSLGNAVKIPGKVDEFEGDFKNGVTKFEETRKIYDGLPLLPKEDVVQKNFEDKWESYLSLCNKAFEMAKALKPQSPTQELEIFLNDEVDTVRLELVDTIARLSAFQNESAESRAKESEAQAKMLTQVSNLSVIVGFIMAVIIGYLFSKRVSQSLQEFQTKLNEEVSHIKSSSASINSDIGNLDQKISVQASAVQETMVACTEVSEMIEKTSESSNETQTKTNSAADLALQGTQSIKEMAVAMDSIIESFGNIKVEVEKSQKDSDELSRLIGEIKAKTSVINDIVFQTKLLSFNASVEAARAGEHGKGFSVVAEEVGGLARMSGEAAVSINELIDQSASRMNELFAQMQTRIQSQLEISSHKVSTGREKVQECEEIFSSVQGLMNEIQNHVSQVRNASVEQTAGIREITTAVGDIDHASQFNLNLSRNISESVKGFESSSEELSKVAEGLKVIIHGEV